MNCPVCSTELERSLYEGLPVFHCTACQGYLVATKRAADINRQREKTPEELQQEAHVEGTKDSEQALRCPRCRRRMVKELQRGAAAFHLDKCRDCDLVWFDAGELARCQLAYEATARAQEASRLQEQHRQMDPEQKRAFEENLANLPERDSPLSEGVLETMAQLEWILGKRLL